MTLTANTGDAPLSDPGRAPADRPVEYWPTTAIRSALGTPIPAAIITADQSPQVANAAQARDIAVLRKPVKPAPLRALLAHYTLQKAAAE